MTGSALRVGQRHDIIGRQFITCVGRRRSSWRFVPALKRTAGSCQQHANRTSAADQMVRRLHAHRLAKCSFHLWCCQSRCSCSRLSALYVYSLARSNLLPHRQQQQLALPVPLASALISPAAIERWFLMYESSIAKPPTRHRVASAGRRASNFSGSGPTNQ